MNSAQMAQTSASGLGPVSELVVIFVPHLLQKVRLFGTTDPQDEQYIVGRLLQVSTLVSAGMFAWSIGNPGLFMERTIY